MAWTLAQGMPGLENMALIPGTVGASPVQNIGAYGIEMKDRFESLDAVDLVTGRTVTLGPDLCAFGYRDSEFKRSLAGRVVVDGRDVTALAPAARSMGIVFQDGALWPHLTVREHLVFALELQEMTPADMERRLEQVLRTFAYMMASLQNAKTSIKRLRQMLFGARTVWPTVLTGGTMIVAVSAIVAFISGMNVRHRITLNVMITGLAVIVTYVLGWLTKRLLGVEI